MSQIIIFAVISTDMLRCPGDRKIFLAEFFWRQYLEKKKTVSGWGPLSPCVLALLFLAVPGRCLSLP